jgi:hypothetical protein
MPWDALPRVTGGLSAWLHFHGRRVHARSRFSAMGATTARASEHADQASAMIGVLSIVVSLDVRAMIDSLSAHGPKRDTPVTTYKWLLNLDNTGNPHGAQSDLSCHPSSNVATGKTPPAGTLNTNYVVTQYGYPQGCEWSSIRYAVASPALKRGHPGRLEPEPATARFRLHHRARPSQRLPERRATVQGLPLPGLGPPTPTRSAAGTSPSRCRHRASQKSLLNPYPIPLGAARIKVFADISPMGGT